MLFVSVCMHLKNKVWCTVATFLIKRLEQWLKTGCRTVISLADLEDKEFSSGTGPYSGHGCGTFPQPQGDPTGWDSVSSDIDVMWKKLSPLSDMTKLIANLRLSFPVFIPVSRFRASKSCSRGESLTIWSWMRFCFYSLSFIVLTLLLLAGLRWSLRNLLLHRPVCARVGLQGPCSIECGNPWKEAFIQVF